MLQSYNKEKKIFEDLAETEFEDLKAKFEALKTTNVPQVRKRWVRLWYITECKGCGGFSEVEIVREVLENSPSTDGSLTGSLEQGDMLAMEYDITFNQ